MNIKRCLTQLSLIRLCAFSLLMVLNTVFAYGQCSTSTPTYQTVGSAGNWTTAGDWTIGPPPYVLSGGAYTIPAGQTVEIAGNIDINGNLIVNGTLLVSGKLNMPAGGTITVGSGGLVTCCGSGYCGGSCPSCGNSDKITIGGANAWSGAGGGGAPSSGPFTGPKTLTATTLPVELAYFKAIQNSDFITFAWRTSSEINFDYFIVERSFDGKEFFEVGRAGGHGTSKEIHDYNLIDNAPITGLSYYRLKSVDFDGFTEFFSIISVHFNGHPKLSLFPNPAVASESINLSLNFIPEANCTIRISDLFGVEISNYSFTGPFNSVLLPSTPGTYIVSFESGSFRELKRIIVK